MMKQRSVRRKFVINKLSIYTILNAILLCVGILYLYKCGDNATQWMKPHVFHISPIANSTTTAFDMKNVFSIQLRHPDMRISFEATENKIVSCKQSGMEASSAIVYTDAAYAKIYKLTMTDGTFFTEDMAHNPVIVINDSLAWKLFGTLDVLGKQVQMQYEEYEIVGIVQGELGEANACAWMPLLTADQATDIQTFHVNVDDYDTIASYRSVESLLDDVLKERALYRIVDLDEYVLSIQRRPVLLCTIAYAVLVVLLVLAAVYVWRNKMGWNKCVVAALFGIAALAVLFAQGVRFDIWVYQFDDSGISQLWTTLTNSDLLPDAIYLSRNMASLSDLNGRANCVWIVCLVALANLVGTLPFHTWMQAICKRIHIME